MPECVRHITMKEALLECTGKVNALRHELDRVIAERDAAREDLRLSDADVETLQTIVARMVTQATEMQVVLDQRTTELNASREVVIAARATVSAAHQHGNQLEGQLVSGLYDALRMARLDTPQKEPHQ